MTASGAEKSIIRFADATKTLGTIPVLDHISLSVAPHEHVALIGASGCGKTTLLRCINALERIDSGELHVNGYDLTADRFDRNRFRSGIGYVFQQFNLFPHLDVLGNIMLGPVRVKGEPPAAVRDKAMDLLRRIGMDGKARAFPHELSGGQQQRAAIARSLLMNPDILLLDEPTSALDPPMTWEVLSLIEELATDNMTVVMVTHELRFVERFAHRVLLMHQGRVLEDGPPEQVLYHPQHEETRAYLRTFHGEFRGGGFQRAGA